MTTGDLDTDYTNIETSTGHTHVRSSYRLRHTRVSLQIHKRQRQQQPRELLPPPPQLCRCYVWCWWRDELFFFDELGDGSFGIVKNLKPFLPLVGVVFDYTCVCVCVEKEVRI